MIWDSYLNIVPPSIRQPGGPALYCCRHHLSCLNELICLVFWGSSSVVLPEQNPVITYVFAMDTFIIEICAHGGWWDRMMFVATLVHPPSCVLQGRNLCWSQALDWRNEWPAKKLHKDSRSIFLPEWTHILFHPGIRWSQSDNCIFSVSCSRIIKDGFLCHSSQRSIYTLIKWTDNFFGESAQTVFPEILK